MKEQELNFTRDDNPTIVSLNDDQKAVIEKRVNEMFQSLNLIKVNVKKGELQEGFKTTLLSVTESYFVDILKTLDYDSHLAKEKEHRHAEIRSLNSANRELRKQLGEKVSAEDVREKLKNLSDTIRKWWIEDGLGHVSEIRYNESGMAKIKLSCSLFGDFGLLDDDEPVTSKERKQSWLESLVTADGLALQKNNFGDDQELIDNDHNRDILFTQIKKRFPSAFIVKTTNNCGRNSNPVLRDIVFMLDELTDI